MGHRPGQKSEAKFMFEQRDGTNPELIISGGQVLGALATGAGLMGLLVWVFVRYWLFGP
jgi:hypothetical protein